VGPILVTGGTGTLGRRLVPRLAAQDVRVLRPPGRGPAGWVTGDLRRGSGIDAAVAGARVVLPVRLPGAAFAGYRRGDSLAPDHAAGRITFAQFLQRA
jgi:nucleoside-diphosphate-sugar epimerase